ncbi:MAG: hypothetical protein ACPG4T_05075 [Nannocystaceae bacterium]
MPDCSNPYALVARVRNVGQAAAPPGIPVSLYDGDPDDNNNPGTLLGPTMFTTQTLYPADAEDLILPLPDVPEGIKDGSIPVYGVVDDQDPNNHVWQECRTENNKTEGSGKCFIPG